MEVTAILQNPISVTPHQLTLSAAVEALALRGGIEARGAIFTRAEVVDFILDLVGYTEDKPLHNKRLLEPSFGGGDFLLPIIERLFSSLRIAKNEEDAVDCLGEALRAVELHRDTFSDTRQRVIARIEKEGISHRSAIALADRWLKQADFLLTPPSGPFDFVVGNPPYVRQELISPPLLAEYRNRYHTMYDRADLYIPFIECALLKLSPKGCLGFICSDRWMKNRYGGPLRKLVADYFHLKIHVDMVDTPAFHSDVIAYPAITIISREKAGSTRVAYRPSLERSNLLQLSGNLLSKTLPNESGLGVHELAHITNGAEPWLLESADQTALIRRLEREYPTLEETGCKVGIGVATGADKAFIGDFASLDVEEDRKLPLVTTQDILSGEVGWRGLGVINPFRDDGRLVDLQAYPRLRRYLEERKDVIAKRHCAQKTPLKWYRTIDRIIPALAKKQKLLIPDIKGKAHIVFEQGELYPHHNLYYVVSENWNIHALQAVLLSDVTRLFIATYSTKMRGGFLRFQAQYLRRIRIPLWTSVPLELQERLAGAAISRDLQACNDTAFQLYGLSYDEKLSIGGNGRYVA